MKAVILAGGEGTRLRPLTSNQPKPMMPLVNKPMLEHIVGLLSEHGIDDIVVTIAYLGNQIRDYFGDGSDFGVRMRYAAEDQPLGTAGSVRNAADELDETFLVISGDVLTDIDLTAFVDAHRARGGLASIALKRVENPLDFGIVITRPDGSIERFLEKPTWGEVFSDTINTGIYVLEPEIFRYIPADEVVDFSGDVFPAVLADGGTILGHVAEGYWEDVGTTEAYLRAHADVLDGRVGVEVSGFVLSDGVWLGEGAEVHPDARLVAPVVVGPNCRIDAGAELRPYTVLGTDVVVRPEAMLERTVCHDHVFVGPDVHARGAVIGRSTDLRAHARLDEGVVVGDECFVGEHAVVNPGVRIYPFKTVERDAVVHSSIVWESRAARTLFGTRGLRGLANVDITPEVGVRVAAALGTSLPKGAVVTVSRDTSRAARALKRAVIGGLNLAGVNVEDIELATVPVTRFQVRNSRAQAGVTVRLVPGDSESVEIRFFDETGLDIDANAQRKIERLLNREDFRRAFAGDIGDITFPPRSIEFYTSALERSVDVRAIRARTPKVVLDYSHGAAAMVMPSVLAKLGAEVLAVNPFASTGPALALPDPFARAALLAPLVRASGSDLGFVIGPNGEDAVIVDDEGTVLDRNQMLLLLVALVATHTPDARIALSVSTTQQAVRIAEAHGATVHWTPTGASGLQEVAARGGVAFAASPEGSFLWPDFLPANDASATLAKLLDLLARDGRPCSEIVRGLPAVAMAHEVVPTPWERKGAVMRELVERVPPEQVVLVDGVKMLRDDGWVLVLPDPEEAATHVVAEAGSEAEARRSAEEYARRIRQTLR
jgi:mannose-1-phosphate guanylyltransferase/phosphomannomutase